MSDRGIPFLPLASFSGHPDSTALASPLRCQLLYATLASSIVNANASIDTTALGAASAAVEFPYKILLYDYHRIKEDAVAQGLMMIVNNQLYDISGSSATPYEQKRVFAAAPWRDRPLKEGETYTFVPELVANTLPFTVTSYEVNIGQGFVPIGLGAPFSFSVPAGASSVEFELKANLRTGGALISRSAIPVVPTVAAITPVGYCEGAEFTIEINDIPPIIVGGETDQLFVRTACCDNTVRRPLLIINGFETPLLPDEEEDDIGIDNDFEDILDRLNQFTATPTGNSLLAEFLSSGYDLIFLDFNDETAPLEHNAEIVKQAIREVNAIKTGNEPLVIAGLSMGGVLGKLALLEMEAVGEDHDTRLFISVDSPLRGANLPLGLQHMVHHLNGLKLHVTPAFSITLGTLVPLLSDASFTLKRPSVRQMLVYHSHEALPLNQAHQAFYHKLTSLGKLQNCEHLALAAGSQIGEGQGFPAGSKLFSLEGLTGQLLNELGAVNESWGVAIDIASLLLGTGVYTDIDVWALPDMPASPQFVYRNFTAASVFFISVALDFVRVKVSNTQPFDSGPGGWSALPDQPGILQERFGFIPTISPLEVGPFVSLGAPPGDPFQDISDNQAVLALARTTMDRMVASDLPPPDGNLEHTEPFSTGNTGVLLADLAYGESSDGVLDNRIFNHGDSEESYDYANPPAAFPAYRTEPIIDADLDIINGGELWINRADLISFTDVPTNLMNALGTSFNVYIMSGFCDGTPTVVTLNSGGRMELGEWNNGAGINNRGNVYVMEDASVLVGAQGEVYVNKESEYVIQEGGYTEVQGGGLLSAGFGGMVRIEDGAELRVASGGTLRMSQESACRIEPGGKLVLEAGALVQLWDGEDPFGRAALRSQGLLEVQGELEFSGNGYFDFYAGHSLSLPGGIFRIEGRGYGNRFMRLRAGASLHVGAAKLQLLDGLVEYEYGSALSVAGGQALLLRMELSALSNDQTTGLFLDGASQLRVGYSTFEGFATGVEGYDIQAASPWDFLFFETAFADNRNGIWISGGTIMRAWGCTFLPGAGGVQAMLLDNLAGLRLDNCRIEGYPAPNGLYSQWGAIHLQDVDEAVISGGLIAGNDVGLYCPAGKRANVLLRQQAEVSGNHYYGIHIEQGSREGDNYGMVTMDCARLLGNGLSGIKGKDLVLNIDAYINSRTDDPAYVRANHFQRSAQGQWFDVCYTGPLAEQINSIPATGNYWGTDNANPAGPPYHYSLHKYVCGGFPSISLFAAAQAASEPAGCPSPPPGGPLPHGLACEIEAGPQQEAASEVFQGALGGYLQKIAQDESTAAARQPFEAVAAISNAERAAGSEACKHYIDVARVLADMAGGPAARALAASEAAAAAQGKRPALASQGLYPLISPNPARSSLYIEVPAPGRFFLRAISAAGQPVLSLAAEGPSAEIDLSRWPEGLYLLDIRLEDGSAAWREKVLVQR